MIGFNSHGHARWRLTLQPQPPKALKHVLRRYVNPSNALAFWWGVHFITMLRI